MIRSLLIVFFSMTSQHCYPSSFIKKIGNCSEYSKTKSVNYALSCLKGLLYSEYLLGEGTLDDVKYLLKDFKKIATQPEYEYLKTDLLISIIAQTRKDENHSYIVNYLACDSKKTFDLFDISEIDMNLLTRLNNANKVKAYEYVCSVKAISPTELKAKGYLIEGIFHSIDTIQPESDIKPDKLINEDSSFLSIKNKDLLKITESALNAFNDTNNPHLITLKKINQKIMDELEIPKQVRSVAVSLYSKEKPELAIDFMKYENLLLNEDSLTLTMYLYFNPVDHYGNIYNNNKIYEFFELLARYGHPIGIKFINKSESVKNINTI